jgi:hypothetical protein
MLSTRHCEAPLGDEAIQGRSTMLAALDCRAASRLAMTIAPGLSGASR